MKRLALWLLLLIMPVMVYAAAPMPPPSSITRLYLPIVSTPSNERHGLAWSYISRSLNSWDEFNLSWYYHWGSKAVSHVPGSVEFVPMLWSDDLALKTAFLLRVPTDYCGYILFANEPEFSTQANMTVDEVVSLLDWLVEHYPCALFVGPQTHVCWYENDPPVGQCPALGPRFTVENFILTYRATHQGNNPPIAAYGLHYGDVLWWPNRIGAMLDRLGVDAPMWYTEFDYCGASVSQFRLIMDYLNRHPRIDRYAYWSNLREDNRCSLSDFVNGGITWQGVVYAESGLR